MGKKFGIILMGVTVCLIAGAGTWAAPLSGYTPAGYYNLPAGKTTGGPDAYGYSYIDNNPVQAGSPTYDWIDTTGAGWVNITGLGDDNEVGPYSIGFDFPYYWNAASQFWVHANGGISFSAPLRGWTPYVSGENGFPNLAQPQDLIGALGIDLDFTYAGKCKYRSRNDSLVVTFVGVRGWNTTAWYNFQIILTKADSSIKLQYNRIDAAIPTANLSIGVENASGTVGLSYYNNGTPAGNLPAAGRAVRIYPPASSVYAATDAGMAWALNEQSGAVVLHTLDMIQPRASVFNYGTGPVVIPMTVCYIKNAAGTVVFADTIVNISLAKGQQQDTTFAKTFSSATAGTYTLVAKTEGLTESPANPANDSIAVELPVVTYQSWLRYDDNSAESYLAWSGASSTALKGFGSYFELSRYPVMLDSAQVYINYRNKDSIYIQIYDATGPGGGPGSLLATDTLKLSGNNQYRWMSVSYTTRNVTVPTGKFYVCVKTPNSTVRFGLDQAQPVSRRTWEFTGSWTPYRGLERQDVMIRANVHKPGNSAIYVDAASGSDLNPGTSALPLKTMTHALEVVSSTDSCYVRSGSYTGRLTFTPRHSGTATNRTVITAQAGHTPLLYSGGADGSLIDSAASYITFNGFTVYPGSLVSAYFQDAADVLFSNNRIYVPTMGYGLLAVGLTASLFKGNTVGPIADNVNPAEGIYLWATDQIRLDSNRVSGMIDAGIVLSMDDRTIACRNLVTGNLMGIALDMSGNDSIFNNTISGNGDAGIYSNGLMGSAATLNNIIAGNGYGFGWVDGGGALSSDYNDVWGNIYSDYNYGTYPVAAGANDISADPLYDASYHLLTGSPCINAGIAVGLPSVGAPDIGAFESGFKGSPAGFGEDGGTANYRFGLWGSRPNPFRNTTTVVYSCPNPRAGEPAVQKVSLRVYNIAGQAVRTLVESAQSPGIHSVRWDGRDQSGLRVANGVYYLKLEIGRARAVSRIALIK